LLIYIETHTVALIEKAHTSADLQKEAHSGCYREGHTQLVIY